MEACGQILIDRKPVEFKEQSLFCRTALCAVNPTVWQIGCGLQYGDMPFVCFEGARLLSATLDDACPFTDDPRIAVQSQAAFFFELSESCGFDTFVLLDRSFRQLNAGERMLEDENFPPILTRPQNCCDGFSYNFHCAG